MLEADFFIAGKINFHLMNLILISRALPAGTTACSQCRAGTYWSGIGEHAFLLHLYEEM